MLGPCHLLVGTVSCLKKLWNEDLQQWAQQSLCGVTSNCAHEFTYCWNRSLGSVSVDISAVSFQLIQDHCYILIIHQLHQDLQHTASPIILQSKYQLPTLSANCGSWPWQKWRFLRLAQRLFWMVVWTDRGADTGRQITCLWSKSNPRRLCCSVEWIILFYCYLAQVSRYLCLWVGQLSIFHLLSMLKLCMKAALGVFSCLLNLSAVMNYILWIGQQLAAANNLVHSLIKWSWRHPDWHCTSNNVGIV